MTKSAPFSLRLNDELDAWVTQEARRTKRSKGAVVEALAEEGARMRRFPGIAFRGPEHDRRAWIIGSAMDVWEVIEALHSLGSVERLVEVGDVSERHLKLAAAYYDAHPDEIDLAIAANRGTQADLHRLYPTFVPKP
jgi:hypothetical protein